MWSGCSMAKYAFWVEAVEVSGMMTSETVKRESLSNSCFLMFILPTTLVTITSSVSCSVSRYAAGSKPPSHSVGLMMTEGWRKPAAIHEERLALVIVWTEPIVARCIATL